jgi:hypothetical protein
MLKTDRWFPTYQQFHNFQKIVTLYTVRFKGGLQVGLGADGQN